MAMPPQLWHECNSLSLRCSKSSGDWWAVDCGYLAIGHWSLGLRPSLTALSFNGHSFVIGHYIRRWMFDVRLFVGNSVVIGHWSLVIGVASSTSDLGLWTLDLSPLPDSKGLHLSEEGFVICLEISGSGALISV